MVDVTIKIPEDRVPAFYEMVGRWLTGTAGTASAATSEGAESTLEPWGRDDVELARSVWAKLTEPAKRMFEVLISEPGRHVSAEELANDAVLDDRFVLAGTLAWPGRYCYAVGRKVAIEWSSQSDGSKYWMEPVTADVFRQAKELGEAGR